MANTVALTTLLDGPKTRVVSVLVTWVDSQETDTVIYDFSADANNINGVAGSGKVKNVWCSTVAGQCTLEWDGTTDFAVAHFAPNQNNTLCFDRIGGVKNNAGTPTGDLTLTTLGLAAVTDKVWMIVEIDKY